jgi:hypothetical protein
MKKSSAQPGYRSHSLLIVLCACLCSLPGEALKAQLRVLFLGNSYTHVNNLPQLVSDVALSAGDALFFDSYAPGGYRLQDHNNDITGKNKIMAGGWNYVVLQGQSQEPVLSPAQFSNGGLALYKLIRQYNPCAVTMPYMTWGRKNGDASNCSAFPLMCTYPLMDSALKARYLDLTDFINGEVSPVSAVWKYLRKNHPGIELYQADESHPSLAGSYAAACCFYVALFKKDPTLITFDPGLSTGEAAAIRNAARLMVFDSLPVWDFKKPPVSRIGYQIGAGINEVLFSPKSSGVQQSYLWSFGDGATSTSLSPTHSYSSNGTYTVVLTTSNCDQQGTHTSVSDTVIQFCSHTPTVYTSHPWLCHYDTLWTQAADAHQWFSYGLPLPETNPYLADYARYNLSGFSVRSTLNGCSELSRMFTKAPVWSGYYFDVLGDPCAGDTVAFAVLHTNGFLSGKEKILWFKNGMPLTSMSGSDTLIISGPGNYECKVLNPDSDCPFDTTAYRIEYDCGTITGMEDKVKQAFFRVFPNPASESITVNMVPFSLQDHIQIYDATGRLVRSFRLAGESTELDISDLANGLYYIHLENKRRPPLKFSKY